MGTESHWDRVTVIQGVGDTGPFSDSRGLERSRHAQETGGLVERRW